MTEPLETLLEGSCKHLHQNSSRVGEESCTVWYDKKGVIYGVGADKPVTPAKLTTVLLKFDIDHFCPRAALASWNAGNAHDKALGMVLAQIKKYRESKGYDRKTTV
ncbi:hypothetical protein HY493_05005 [Candidatus Woesearchaeota archaeon]|nr:hypothetical protein [Candidatus Woesearchaeota archaeon]